jgi:CHAT domain-containing protein
VPGYADFLRPLGFSEIQAAAEPAPLVYVVVTGVGGMALVVWSEKQQRVSSMDTVPLPSLTESALGEQLFGAQPQTELGGYLGAYAGRVPGKLTFMRWMNALDEITEWLWHNVMEQIVDAIRRPDQAPLRKEDSVPPATLIPAGFLALLPLHAAWRYDSASPSGRRYALDDVSWSYAPNARTLVAERERAAGLPAEKLLLVTDPQPVSAAVLPHALEEAQKIIELWPETDRTSLPARAATLDEVTRLLPHHSVFHYTGHAFTSWDMPQDGGLLLANDRVLTVREFHGLHLRMRLAVLSACETGVPGARIPDEVIGLPTALVEAGLIGVVASLWSVPDETTAQLMEDFYVRWRRPELLARPSEALRRAQLALRDGGGGHEHPYYWAAFAYNGV